MSRTGLGWGLLGLGAVLVAAGVAGLLGEETPPDLQAADITTNTAAEPSTTTELTASSTSMATTTTSTSPTTTIPAETVEEFVETFDASLETDDESFLFDRLHPVVIEGYGEELCREWIAREIVELSDYRLTGEPEGPEPRTVQTPQGEREIDLISAPVSFTFQGQSFEATAGFSLVDGLVHWVGECR